MEPEDTSLHDIYPPSADFSAAAHVKSMEEYEAIYAASIADPQAWWASQAEHLVWQRPWDQTLDWSEAPFAKWFVGGKINAAENCLDRHVAEGRGEQVAFHWIGEPGDTRDLTYR